MYNIFSNLTVHVIRSLFLNEGAYVHDWSKIDKQVSIDFPKDMGLTGTSMDSLRGIRGT